MNQRLPRHGRLSTKSRHRPGPGGHDISDQHPDRRRRDRVRQRCFAASDPYFPENIEPFSPGLPLLVIARTGQASVQEPGMPSFDARFENMTLPKINTLRSWGWQVRVLHGRDQGTSFGEGPAQRWTLSQLAELLPLTVQ